MRLYEDEKLVDALVEEKVLLWSSKNLSLNLHGIDAVSTAGARPPLVEVPPGFPAEESAPVAF